MLPKIQKLFGILCPKERMRIIHALNKQKDNFINDIGRLGKKKVGWNHLFLKWCCECSLQSMLLRTRSRSGCSTELLEKNIFFFQKKERKKRETVLLLKVKIHSTNQNQLWCNNKEKKKCYFFLFTFSSCLLSLPFSSANRETLTSKPVV